MGVLYDDVYMYVFGGRSSTRFYNDLWRFHLRQREWEMMEPRTEVVPSARAFHSVETHGYVASAGARPPLALTLVRLAARMSLSWAGSAPTGGTRSTIGGGTLRTRFGKT